MDRSFRRVVLACGVGLALAAIGAAFGVRAAERAAVDAWTSDLRTTAADRRGAVESWLEGRRSIVRVAAKYPTVVWLVSGRPRIPPDALPFPSDAGAEAHVKQLFDTLCEESGYASAIVVNGAGIVLASGGVPTIADLDPKRLHDLAAKGASDFELDVDPDECVARTGARYSAPS
jgi:hypothetical protein